MTEKQLLFMKVFEEISKAVNDGYYTDEDLTEINFSEICDWCNFPDLQDWGYYEQIIVVACEALKALYNVNKF